MKTAIINIFELAIAVVIFAPLTWWSIDRNPSFKVLGSTPIPNPAHHGDDVDFQWVVDVNKQNCETVFQRYFIDSSGSISVYTPSNSSYSSLPLGRNQLHTTKPFRVPLNAPIGAGRVYNVYTIKCNPVHWVFPIIYKTPDALVNIVK